MRNFSFDLFGFAVQVGNDKTAQCKDSKVQVIVFLNMVFIRTSDSYKIYLAFLAAPLASAAPAAFLVTALMTPTATVCLISRTAKRPRGA